MENEKFSKIGSIPEIGFNKYKFLKSLIYTDLTEIEKKQIEDYENRFQPSPEQLAFKKKYIERVFAEPEQIEFELKKGWFWKNFIINYKELNGKDFIENEDTISNIKAVMLYFLKDEEFFKCENLSKISNPDFNKGLLILGNFGNGKTSTLKTIEKTLKNIKGYNFRTFNANEVVKMFESISIDNYTIDLSRKDFDRKMYTGDICFDDVLTEREAYNFGKFNLFKEILEMRCPPKYKTYLTINFDSNYPNDIHKALDQFAVKYGDRVYDRIFEMFNIIVFNGKSFRL